MKRLLMIAFHYPPASGTSGVQRALRFSSHLPEFGWQPIVLTANARAYEHRSDDLMSQVPSEVPVIRAQAWDAKRHFSVCGRYPTVLALPDRWASWLPGALLSGMSAVRKYRPDAIWSTYPIATAHRIGALLARLYHLPLIADFRDPMAQAGYPVDPLVWRSFDRVERSTIRVASLSTFTTPGAVEIYKARYPTCAHGMHLLENGYDESVFARHSKPISPLNPGKLTLLHSGIVYPSERDPSSLFAAMRLLRSAAPETLSQLTVRFRAAVHEKKLHELARHYCVEEAVQILPPVSYAEAIQEMQEADGLLILQASNCNAQIPAKFYEYLKAGPPILLLTDPSGDTATAARKVGIERVATFNNPDEIKMILDEFICGRTRSMMPEASAVYSATRRSRTEELARLLSKLD